MFDKKKWTKEYKKSPKVRARYSELQRGYHATRLQAITDLKKVPCVRCKKRYPSVCMDFDHVRGKKEFQISDRYSSYSLKRLLVEIAKCQVVCANCHRIISWERRQAKREVR